MAIDGISWRPLLEDLATAYLADKVGQAVVLPAEDNIVQEMGRAPRGIRHDGLAASQIGYWESVSEPHRVAEAVQPLGKLPVGESAAANTEGSSATLRVSLTAEETLALLQQVPAAYNTQINDVLLTALLRAWTGGAAAGCSLPNLEGHGRENLFDDVDLSRTVGWFTSIFPVCLEMPGSGSEWQPGEALKSVKEQLRRIPSAGLDTAFCVI